MERSFSLIYMKLGTKNFLTIGNTEIALNLVLSSIA